MHMLIATGILTAACAALFIARKRLGLFWSGSLFLVATVLYLQNGITPPAPNSIIMLYGGTTFIALIIYVTSSEAAMSSVWSPIKSLMVTPSKKATLYLLLAFLPGLVAWQAYVGNLPSTVAPPRVRSVHPPPPNSINIQTPNMSEPEAFNVIKGASPIRHLEKSDPAKFAEHIARGKHVYYENCYYCHGDTMGADGHFAAALNPRPANFLDPGVLPQLQEAFLYWRVAKGGPGMPESGGPWDSSMPAWEKFLSKDDMWNVIAFLYDYTNFTPRAAESVEGH